MFIAYWTLAQAPLAAALNPVRGLQHCQKKLLQRKTQIRCAILLGLTKNLALVAATVVHCAQLLQNLQQPLLDTEKTYETRAKDTPMRVSYNPTKTTRIGSYFVLVLEKILLERLPGSKTWSELVALLHLQHINESWKTYWQSKWEVFEHSISNFNLYNILNWIWENLWIRDTVPPLFLYRNEENVCCLQTNIPTFWYNNIWEQRIFSSAQVLWIIMWKFFGDWNQMILIFLRKRKQTNYLFCIEKCSKTTKLLVSGMTIIASLLMDIESGCNFVIYMKILCITHLPFQIISKILNLLSKHMVFFLNDWFFGSNHCGSRQIIRKIEQEI